MVLIPHISKRYVINISAMEKTCFFLRSSTSSRLRRRCDGAGLGGFFSWPWSGHGLSLETNQGISWLYIYIYITITIPNDIYIYIICIYIYICIWLVVWKKDVGFPILCHIYIMENMMGYLSQSSFGWWFGTF